MSAVLEINGVWQINTCILNDVKLGFFFTYFLLFIFFQLTWTKFPCVLKAGHCHGGVATAKIDSLSALQDAVGLLNGTNLTEQGSYCSLEPFIDSKFDVHIQKIGTSYKAFM